MDNLQDTVRTAVYRIVQEAVNNALKHGECSRIDVRIAQSDSTVTVTIDDDGTGIEEADLQSRSGISNIKTRTDLISAQVFFERLDGSGGTRVMIVVPMDEEQAESDYA